MLRVATVLKVVWGQCTQVKSFKVENVITYAVLPRTIAAFNKQSMLTSSMSLTQTSAIKNILRSCIRRLLSIFMAEMAEQWYDDLEMYHAYANF